MCDRERNACLWWLRLKRGIQRKTKFPFSAHTTIFLNPLSETKEVASRALPFAQFLNPPACSANPLSGSWDCIHVLGFVPLVKDVTHHERVVELNRPLWKTLLIGKKARMNLGNGQSANAPVQGA